MVILLFGLNSREFRRKSSISGVMNLNNDLKGVLSLYPKDFI